MAQSTEIALGSMLRGLAAHLRKYFIWLLVITSSGFLVTLYLSSGFETKYAARGIFSSEDDDLKADFIYFRSLSDQYERNKNSEIKALYINELKLDDGSRALDIIIHVATPSDELVEEFNHVVLARNLKEEVPFILNKNPILTKFSILLSGGIISLLTALLLSDFIEAWRVAGK